MDEIETDLARAGGAIERLASGEGAAAADVLERAFEQAGARIEETLAQAARTGELEFERMAETILRDLARITTEGLFGGGGNGPSQTVNLNLASGGGGDPRGILASQGAITAALARAVAQGGRFL